VVHRAKHRPGHVLLAHLFVLARTCSPISLDDWSAEHPCDNEVGALEGGAALDGGAELGGGEGGRLGAQDIVAVCKSVEVWQALAVVSASTDTKANTRARQSKGSCILVVHCMCARAAASAKKLRARSDRSGFSLFLQARMRSPWRLSASERACFKRTRSPIQTMSHHDQLLGVVVHRQRKIWCRNAFHVRRA